MGLLSIHYPFASNLNTRSRIKKSLDYSVFLRTIARLPYPLMAQFAFWRGRAMAQNEGDAFNAIMRNMASVFPEWDGDIVRHETLRLFEYASLEDAEGARIALRDGEYLERFVAIDGAENLKLALSKGKGAIITYLHMGSFGSVSCRLGMHLEQRIYSIAWPYQTCPCPVYRSFIHRKISGINFFLRGGFFFVGRISPQELYQVLARNDIIIILIDAPLGRSKLEAVNFLGRTVHLPLSAFKLAAKTNTALVPIGVFRENNDLTIRAKVLEPRFVPSKEKAKRIFQEVLKELETFIIEYPSQFFYWTSSTSWKTLDVL